MEEYLGRIKYRYADEGGRQMIVLYDKFWVDGNRNYFVFKKVHNSEKVLEEVEYEKAKNNQACDFIWSV